MITSHRTWTDALDANGLRALLDVIRRKHWMRLEQSEIGLVDRVQRTLDAGQLPASADRHDLHRLVMCRLTLADQQEVMERAQDRAGPDRWWADHDASTLRHLIDRIQSVATNPRLDPAVRCEQIEELIMELDRK